MSYCQDCKHYAVHRLEGPMCTKGKQSPTSPLAKKDCFEEQPGAGDAEVPSILANVPDAPARPSRGRKKEHENYMTEDGVLMKWCRNCKQYKPASEFYKKTGTPDGYAYDCKKCRTECQKDYRDRKREQEADMVRRLKEAEANNLEAPVPEETVEAKEKVVVSLPVEMPDFDDELDKALYGDAIVREDDGVFLNFNGVFIPIVDWKSGSYGIKPSGLRRLAKYFFNLGTENANNNR